MSGWKAYTLEEAVEIIEAFSDDELDDVAQIDIVELPPENVDIVSDQEEFDEEDLGPQAIVADTTGQLEVHLHGGHDNSEKDEEAGPEEPKPKKTKKEKKSVNWKKNMKDATCNLQGTNYNHNDCIQHLHNLLGDKNPYEIFNVVTEGLFEKCSEETMRYAEQMNNDKFVCTPNDIKVFVGILILSGHHCYPRQECYWSTDQNFDCPLVRNAMTKNRYKEIKKCLHFNDNSKIPDKCEDKCYKIRPILDICNHNFNMFGYFVNKFSIDEKIVEYFGRHPIKQYIRGKPIRFGLKEWALCGTNGYTFQFSVYQGKHETTIEEKYTDWNLGAKVVLSLADKLPLGGQLFFDNFFTDIQLIDALSQKEICATGTVRFNRLANCPFTPKAQWSKKERGSMEFAVEKSTGIFAICWKDNNLVTAMSNVHGLNPVAKVTRRKKGGKQQIDMPQIISQYNSGMLGVDLADWKTQKYRISIKGKKWYFTLFTHCLDVVMVNCHELYKIVTTDKNPMDLLEFRCYITSCLLKTECSQKPHGRAKPNVSATCRIPTMVRSLGHHILQRTTGKQ